MSHRRRINRDDDVKGACPAFVNICAGVPPYYGGMEAIIGYFIEQMKDDMTTIELYDGNSIIVINADRAAARSATAEGKAGLHETIDAVVAEYGDAKRLDDKG